MRILFDQATPVPVRAFLKGHAIRAPAQEGWDKLRNSELLESKKVIPSLLSITRARF
jgi:hypothetical protein